MTQKVFQAAAGTHLTDIVDFTVNLGGDTSLTGGAELGNTVQLVDRATNTVVASHYYWPTLFNQTISDSLPLASDNPVVMPNAPFYLELQVIRHSISIAPIDILDDFKDLQAIALPGTVPPGGISPSQVPVVLGLVAVAGISFVALGVNRLRRGKRRR